VAKIPEYKVCAVRLEARVTEEETHGREDDDATSQANDHA
jgi:hypothetical protein